jgi:hypothetical protein
MASITRITIAAVALGVLLTASISQGSPAKSTATAARANWWVQLDTQHIFPKRDLDARCTGRPPLTISYGSRAYGRFGCVVRLPDRRRPVDLRVLNDHSFAVMRR